MYAKPCLGTESQELCSRCLDCDLNLVRQTCCRSLRLDFSMQLQVYKQSQLHIRSGYVGVSCLVVWGKIEKGLRSVLTIRRRLRCVRLERYQSQPPLSMSKVSSQSPNVHLVKETTAQPVCEASQEMEMKRYNKDRFQTAEDSPWQTFEVAIDVCYGAPVPCAVVPGDIRKPSHSLNSNPILLSIFG